MVQIRRELRDRDTLLLKCKQVSGEEVITERIPIADAYLHHRESKKELQCRQYGRATPTWQQSWVALASVVTLGALIRYHGKLPFAT